MPIGVIVNALAVFAGGIAGALAGGGLSERFKENMNLIFAACSMTLGIVSIVLMVNMPVVILSVLLGTAIGLAAHLGDRINQAGGGMRAAVSRLIKPPNSGLTQEDFNAQFTTAVVIFCTSGTGIYGSIVSGMTGDHSVLIAKSILDFFTALIFACTLGAVVAVIAIPEAVIFLLLFFGAGLIFPMTTPEMIGDFKAVGGVVLLANGFRIMKVRMFPTADMIPAMVLAMPLSGLWTAYIAPLVA